MINEFEWIYPFALYADRKGHSITVFLNTSVSEKNYLSEKQIEKIKSIFADSGIDVISEPLFGSFFEKLYNLYQRVLGRIGLVLNQRYSIIKLSDILVKRFLGEMVDKKKRNYLIADMRRTLAFSYYSANRKIVLFPHVPGIMMSFSYLHTDNGKCDAALESSKISDYSLRYFPRKTHYVGLPGSENFVNRYGRFSCNSNKILFILQKCFEPSGFTPESFFSYIMNLNNCFNANSFEVHLKFHPKTDVHTKNKYLKFFENFIINIVDHDQEISDISYRCVLTMFSTAGIYYIPQGIPVFHINASPEDMSVCSALDRTYYYNHEIGRFTTKYNDIGVYEWSDDPSLLLKKILDDSYLRVVSKNQKNIFCKYWPDRSEQRILDVLDKI